jgi:hypothetical protein
MQIVVSAILSFTILIQSIGFNIDSLVQLDDFWQHYQEHKEEDGDDFLTFLDLHYGSQQQEHKDEHPEHHDLPTQHCSHTHYTYFVEARDFSFDIISAPEHIQHNFGYSVLFNSLLETDILQPPKSLV